MYLILSIMIRCILDLFFDHSTEEKISYTYFIHAVVPVHHRKFITGSR